MLSEMDNPQPSSLILCFFKIQSLERNAVQRLDVGGLSINR